MNVWMIAAAAAGLYCFLRGVFDLRQRRYAWGALGLLRALLLWTTPIQTNAVKYDLPPPAGTR